MQKIIEYLQTLAIDANTQAKFLLAFLHLPIVGVLLFIAKEERFQLIKKMHRKALLYVLGEFTVFCHQQYKAAVQCIENLTPVKGPIAELHFTGIKNSSHLKNLWMVMLQNPSVFLYQRYALKTGARLFELRDKIGFQQENTHDFIQYFGREYKSCEQRYYENIAALAGLYDMLEENLAKKTLNKGNDPEWARDYLRIFMDWRAGGANREIDVSYKEIVAKVLQLNKLYKDVSFVVRAGEIAFTCEIAYTGIVKMRNMLREKLQQFAWHHRLAYRIAKMVMNKLDPDTAVRPYRARVQRITERNLRIMERDMHKLAAPDMRVSRGRMVKKALYAGLALLVITSIVLTLHSWPGKTKQQALAPAVKPLQPAFPVKDTVKDIAADTAMPSVLPLLLAKPTPRVYGIDISKYQGNLLKDISNMDTLHFVICKATEGNTYTDPDFAANWKFIRAKGLVRGAYHFYHHNDDPIIQAQHFLEAIKNIDSADIPPVIDIEEGSLEGVVDIAGLQNNLFVFLHYVEQKIKRKPVIYTDLFFADTYLNSSSFGDYPLWLAEYSGKNNPQMPRAWKGKKYAIWQKKDTYKIDSRNTDFDVFNGSGNELADFIRRY